MFKIYGNRESFFQWDSNQKLIVNNPLCSEVHFSNLLSNEALVCRAYELEGEIVVDVPNILLTEALDIKAYIVEEDGGGCRTCNTGVFEVVKREKPADYVYTETEVKRYEDFEERIAELEKDNSGKTPTADWNLEQPSGLSRYIKGYIANKPEIKKGEYNNSIKVWDGDVYGDCSLAIGSYDLHNISSIVGGLENDLANPITNADLSISFGVSTNTYGLGSVAIGANTVSGCMGFYWYSIDVTNKKIRLSATQRDKGHNWNDLCQSSLANWRVGDVINLTVNTKYAQCSKITKVDYTNGYITVDKLPFTSVSYPTITMYDDYAVINPSRASCGVVSFGVFSMAAGGNNHTAGNFSQAFGFDNKTINDFAFVEGRENIAGYAAHAEGMNTEAIGNASHAEGYKNIATGNYSHAEGCNTQAINDYTHAEGSSTIASGRMAHAEGNNTKATGYASHAEGDGTIASASEAHAEGGGCVASAYCSHAEGAHTIASASYQHVQGKFNVDDTSKVHIVGWGSSDTARANIHTIDTSGNGWFKGSVEAAAIILTSPNGTRYKVTVDNSGNLTTVKA